LRTRTAIEIALDLKAAPSFVKVIRKRPLPPDVTSVIRVAAGLPQLTQEFAGKYHCSESYVREACIFFLQQAVLFSGADNYRTLGLSPGASLEQIREHRRWLLMWLHPDRNKDKWESALFDRVVSAANAIGGPLPNGTTQPVKKPVKRRHRSLRSSRSTKRPETSTWSLPSLKPVILLILATTAFLLSIATVVSVLGAEAQFSSPQAIDPAIGWVR
jgi:hypothetical protein